MSLQSLLRSFNIRTRMWGAIAMVLGLLALVAGVASTLRHPVPAKKLG